jgi:hypothetical protein
MLGFLPFREADKKLPRWMTTAAAQTTRSVHSGLFGGSGSKETIDKLLES